jgi:hypothetical protein
VSRKRSYGCGLIFETLDGLKKGWLIWDGRVFRVVGHPGSTQGQREDRTTAAAGEDQPGLNEKVREIAMIKRNVF